LEKGTLKDLKQIKMSEKSSKLVEGVIKYVYAEVYELGQDLKKNNKSLFNDRGYIDISDFHELENLIRSSNDYIEDASEKVDYYIATEDGYSQSTSLFGNIIMLKLAKLEDLELEKIVKSQWVSDTINYHAYEYFKTLLKIRYDDLKKTYKKEYLLFKNKSEISISNFNKIKCGTDFTRICYLMSELTNFGYFEFPMTINGKLDRSSIAETFKNIFETDVSVGTIKDYLGGSKQDRTTTAFVNALKIGKPKKRVLEIPSVSDF
jgi:hypothetical protein